MLWYGYGNYTFFLPVLLTEHYHQDRNQHQPMLYENLRARLSIVVPAELQSHIVIQCDFLLSNTSLFHSIRLIAAVRVETSVTVTLPVSCNRTQLGDHSHQHQSLNRDGK